MKNKPLLIFCLISIIFLIFSTLSCANNSLRKTQRIIAHNKQENFSLTNKKYLVTSNIDREEMSSQIFKENEPVVTIDPEVWNLITSEPFMEEEWNGIFSLDHASCQDYCWHGLQLGVPYQTAVQTIQNYPWTPAISELITIYEFEAYTSWFIPPIYLRSKQDYSASIYHRNGIVNQIKVPFFSAIRFDEIVNIWGEPDYVYLTLSGNSDKAFFYTIYVNERIEFLVQGEGDPMVINGHNLVAGAIMYEEKQDYSCLGLSTWKGWGGENLYYYIDNVVIDDVAGDHADFFLKNLREAIPSNCFNILNNQLPLNEIVLLVTHENVGRIYPISHIQTKHVINDILGETPIVIFIEPTENFDYIVVPKVRIMNDQILQFHVTNDYKFMDNLGNEWSTYGTPIDQNSIKISLESVAYHLITTWDTFAFSEIDTIDIYEHEVEP